MARNLRVNGYRGQFKLVAVERIVTDLENQ